MKALKTIHTSRWIIDIAAVALCCYAGFAAPGHWDVAFAPALSGGSGPAVRDLALQPDGRILLGGEFTFENGSGIARLHRDGAVEREFEARVSGWVHALAVQRDGKILIGGFFTNVNGINRRGLARLLPNGALDSDFSADVAGEVRDIALDAGENILIGGRFTNVAGIERRNLARLSSEGIVDGSFAPAPNDFVFKVAYQADGRIVVGGYFTAVGDVARNHIARLTAEGAVDSGFVPDETLGDFSYVSSIAVQADGKILAGIFTTSVGEGRAGIVRFDAAGTLDPSFSPANFILPINSIVLQTDGKMFVGGSFSRGYGSDRNYFARLTASGALDNEFNINNREPDRPVNALAIQPDGRIIVGGSFSSPHRLVARAENNSATESLRVWDSNRIEWLRGGSSPEVEEVTFEQSTDHGGSWALLGFATRILGGWELAGVNLPVGTMIRARGRANSTGSLVETIAITESTSELRLTNPTLLLDGSFRFQLSGDGTNAHTVSVSTNLVNWVPLGSASGRDSGEFEFIDPAATGERRRFYQVRPFDN